MTQPYKKANAGLCGAGRFKNSTVRPIHTTGWILDGGSGSRRSSNTASASTMAFKTRTSHQVENIMKQASASYAARRLPYVIIGIQSSYNLLCNSPAKSKFLQVM